MNELNEKQQTKINETKINEVINSYIDDNFKDYYNTISNDFTIAKYSYEEFKDKVREIILNGFDNYTPTIVSNYYLYTLNRLDHLNNYLDSLDDKETNQLLNFDEDSESFNDNYLDYDCIYDDLRTIFNDEKLDFKESRNDLFLVISDENAKINTDEILKYAEDEDGFFEDLENELYNLDKNNIIKGFIYTFHYDVFKWFVDERPLDKDIKDVVNNIEKAIFNELEKRKENLIKEIALQQTDVLKYSDLIKQETDEYIKTALKEKEERILKSLKDNIEEKESINKHILMVLDKGI